MREELQSSLQNIMLYMGSTRVPGDFQIQGCWSSFAVFPFSVFDCQFDSTVLASDWPLHVFIFVWSLTVLFVLICDFQISGFPYYFPLWIINVSSIFVCDQDFQFSVFLWIWGLQFSWSHFGRWIVVFLVYSALWILRRVCLFCSVTLIFDFVALKSRLILYLCFDISGV